MACALLPACDVPVVTLAPARKKPLRLPQVSENELIRHYTALSHRVHGMNDGFYPLGSCTMKYNPKVNEALAALPGFARLHPLQPEQTAQGALELLYETGKLLGEVTGMDAFTLQPPQARTASLPACCSSRRITLHAAMRPGQRSSSRTPPTARIRPRPSWRASAWSISRPVQTAASISRRSAPPSGRRRRD